MHKEDRRHSIHEKKDRKMEISRILLKKKKACVRLLITVFQYGTNTVPTKENEDNLKLRRIL